MKIIISSNSCWNIINFRSNIIQRLINDKHDVVILAPEDKYKSYIIDLNCKFINISINPSGMNFFEDFLLLFFYLKVFLQQKPDYFLSFTIKPNIYGSIISSILKIKTINNITGLGSGFIGNNFLKNFLFFLYKISLSQSQKVFFHNPDDQDLFLKKKIIKKNISSVIPGSGVNLNKFFFREIKFKNNDERTFLFVGRILFDKGINEFFESAKIIKKKYPKIIFNVLGSIENKNKTSVQKNLIKIWEKSNVIRYFGFIKDVSSFICESDCIVLPSYREGLSKTLLEASAIGRPMIASNVPGCKDIVEDKYNGFLCDKKNIHSLTKAMIKIIELDYENLKIFGMNARKKVERKFDEEIVIAQYIKLLK